MVLITCTYRGQEFIRIGYYVNNEYTDPELRENPPLKPDYTQVTHMFSVIDFCHGGGAGIKYIISLSKLTLVIHQTKNLKTEIIGKPLFPLCMKYC